MNHPIHESVWSLSEPELIQLSQHVHRLLELRRSFASGSSKSSDSIQPMKLPAEAHPPVYTPEVTPLPPKQLPPRSPLKGPRPGSLRGDVHAVLSEAANALSRAEISKRVAKARGVHCNEALTNKVGEILRCPHDHKIKKLRHGIYRYVH
jgi:hypothetical protein